MNRTLALCLAVAAAALLCNGGIKLSKEAVDIPPTLGVSINASNVKFNCGSMGSFELAHPKLKIGSRVRQLMWNGSQRNSSDRSAWGRLTLVP